MSLMLASPGAPSGVYRHWAAFDIAADSHGPKGHGTRHYHFRLLAIARPILDLKPTASVADVLRTAEPYVMQRAEMVGTYHR